MVRAEGAYLFDSDGNRYVDFEAGVWALALGHNHPRINHVIQSQLDQISHISYRYTTDIVEKAAQQVIDITGFDEGQCVFLSSGSEVVELGVQIIRHLSQKPLLLTLHDSFLASYGSAGRRDQTEWFLFDWHSCETCPISQTCDSDCPQIQAIPWEKIGGMVFEPGSSSGLIKFPPAGLIRILSVFTRKFAGLLMANEVTAGLGRTGKWLGHFHYSFDPDTIAMGKGLGNGYPVSVLALDADIALQLKSKGFHYAQSHQNDPLGCAVANEVITILKETQLIERSAELGKMFVDQLNMLINSHSVISAVRGRGLMISLTFDQEKPEIAQRMFTSLLKGGFIVGCKPAHNLLRFLPPLNIAREEITTLTSTLDQELKKL